MDLTVPFLRSFNYRYICVRNSVLGLSILTDDNRIPWSPKQRTTVRVEAEATSLENGA